MAPELLQRARTAVVQLKRIFDGTHGAAAVLQELVVLEAEIVRLTNDAHDHVLRKAAARDRVDWSERTTARPVWQSRPPRWSSVPAKPALPLRPDREPEAPRPIRPQGGHTGRPRSR
jgi:hypothetical protein